MSVQQSVQNLIVKGWLKTKAFAKQCVPAGQASAKHSAKQSEAQRKAELNMIQSSEKHMQSLDLAVMSAQLQRSQRYKQERIGFNECTRY